MLQVNYLLLKWGEDITKFTPVMTILCGFGFLLRWLIYEISVWTIIPIFTCILLLGYFGDRYEKKLDAQERRERRRRLRKDDAEIPSGTHSEEIDERVGHASIPDKRESSNLWDHLAGYCFVIIYLAGFVLFWLFWFWLVFRVSAWAIVPMICVGAFIGWLTWRAETN